MIRDESISRFLALNRKAQVEPDLLELLQAFVGIRRDQQADPFTFYESELDSPIHSRFPTVNRFLNNNTHVDPRVSQFLAQYAEEMRKQRLPFIFNQKHFCSMFDIDANLLKDIINNKSSYYRTFYISKNNQRGKRTIEAPADVLKNIQRKLDKQMLSQVKMSGYAHAYRRDRSIKTNASFHVNKDVVVRIDIKDYFHSFKQESISAYLERLGYTKSVAALIAELVTFKGRMPMGAPTSPSISNLLSHSLDKRLASLAFNLDANYTRYADDLVFSANNRRLPGMIPVIYGILEQEGFNPNRKKTLVRKKWQRQVVTGIVVNKELNVSKDDYRRLRAVVHNCIKGNLEDQASRWGTEDVATFKYQLHGKISYLRYIKPSLGDALLAEYKSINWPA